MGRKGLATLEVTTDVAHDLRLLEEEQHEIVASKD